MSRPAPTARWMRLKASTATCDSTAARSVPVEERRIATGACAPKWGNESALPDPVWVEGPGESPARAILRPPTTGRGGRIQNQELCATIPGRQARCSPVLAPLDCRLLSGSLGVAEEPTRRRIRRAAAPSDCDETSAAVSRRAEWIGVKTLAYLFVRSRRALPQFPLWRAMCPSVLPSCSDARLVKPFARPRGLWIGPQPMRSRRERRMARCGE